MIGVAVLYYRAVIDQEPKLQKSFDFYVFTGKSFYQKQVCN